jgi:hypothetical protein
MAIPYTAPRLAPVPSSTELRLRRWFLKGPRRLALCACLAMVVIGLPFIAYLGMALEKERQEEVIAEANDTMVRKAREARELLSHGDFNTAIAILEEAIAAPSASELDQARVLLHESRQMQARAIMAEAQAAIQKHDLANGRKLLQEVLAHPHAEGKGRARRLADEIDVAVADVKALLLLKKLPAAAFAAYVQGGELASVRAIQNVSLREIYRATLKRNLPRAQTIREEERLARDKWARAEHDRRVTRAKAAPAFREVQELAARIRKRDQQNRKNLESFDRKLIEATGALLTANGQTRQALQQQAAKVKQEQEVAGAAVERWKDQAEEQISRARANVKERVRSYKEFNEDDWRLFDTLADAELDAVLKELRKADEDQGGL